MSNSPAETRQTSSPPRVVAVSGIFFQRSISPAWYSSDSRSLPIQRTPVSGLPIQPTGTGSASH